MIHVGTNNCTSDAKVNTGTSEYLAMVTEVQERAPNTNIIVSTICPRNDEHSGRVNKLNDKIKQIANDRGCVLVDHDKNFKYGDSTVDKLLIEDRGLHLTKAGTKRLLTNLNAVHEIKKSPGSWTKVKRGNERGNRQRFPPRARTYSSRHGALGGTGHGTGRSRPLPQPRSHTPQHHEHGPRPTRGCYFCGANNHMMRNCRYGQPIQCYDCGAYGHKAHQNVCQPF